jgi:hypothetical protein
MARLSLFFLTMLLPGAVLAADSIAQEQWKAFLSKPSAATYAPLSGTIRRCVAGRCRDSDVAGSEDNFANLAGLLGLVKHGSHYGMEIAFEIRPLYENAASESEAIENSLGLSATVEPQFFLELIRKYKVPAAVFERLVDQTSVESIDRLLVQRDELRSRIRALSTVRDPGLSQLRDQAISLTQQFLDEYSDLPDDAGGK